MASRIEMIEWLAVNSPKTGNTTASTVRTYYQHQDESVVLADFTRELTKQQAAPSLQQMRDETARAEAEAAEMQRKAAQAHSDMTWSQICNTPVTHANPKFNNKVCEPTTANRIEVSSWPHEGERPNGEWFRKVISEQPFLANRLSWQEYLTPSAEKQRSKEVDANTLSILLGVCQKYNLSYSQANQTSVLAHYPTGLVDEAELMNAIQLRELHLHSATAAEIEQFTQDLVKAHNDFWEKQSIAYLKEHSALERQQREQIFNRVTPEPSRPVGVVPLPPEITKEKILAALNNRDRDTIHNWKIRYGGMDAINARLQGLA